MSDEALAKESELINLLKKKEQYLKIEEERQFKLLKKKEEKREHFRKQERNKIIEQHEQKHEDELIKLKDELNQMETYKNNN